MPKEIYLVEITRPKSVTIQEMQWWLEDVIMSGRMRKGRTAGAFRDSKAMELKVKRATRSRMTRLWYQIVGAFPKEIKGGHLMKIENEMCDCGHLRSEHNNLDFGLGEHPSLVGKGDCPKCECIRFTWAYFVDSQNKRIIRRKQKCHSTTKTG